MTLHYTQTKIPITRTNIPLPPPDTVIASLSRLATHGTTGVEQSLPPLATHGTTVVEQSLPPLATHGTTGVEQTPKRSRLMSAIHELVNFLCRNSPDAASSRSTSPTLGAFMLAQSGPSRELAQSPQPDPSRELVRSPQPDMSRELVRSPQLDPTVTSLSCIGMSLD
jgi:hypothetical protein